MLSVRSLFRSVPTARRGKRLASFRPVLEPLEERAVPTIYEWTGTEGTGWGNPANWREWFAEEQLQQPPDNQDDVFIVRPNPNNAGQEAHVDSNGTAKTVRVLDNGELVVNSTLEVEDWVDIEIGSTLRVNAGKTLSVTGSDPSSGIDNYGKFFLEGKADVTDSQVFNDWNLITGSNSTVQGPLVNQGALWVGDAPAWIDYATGNLTVSQFLQTSDGTTYLNVNGKTVYDKVHVDTFATFAGHLVVTKTGNFTVRPNMRFTIFYYNNFNGSFAENT